jgi:hypothetical protein
MQFHLPAPARAVDNGNHGFERRAAGLGAAKLRHHHYRIRRKFESPRNPLFDLATRAASGFGWLANRSMSAP